LTLAGSYVNNWAIGQTKDRNRRPSEAPDREDVLPLETIEPRRLYRQVADQLRGLIEDGAFAPGARLPPERELAEKLGISRPTVREALIVLEVEGRVRIRVGSGVYVAQPGAAKRIQAAPIHAEGPFEVLQAREFVESAIVEEAARRASAKDIAELERILDAMARAVQPSPEALRLDRQFHVAIAGILGNGLLERMVGELFDQRVNPYFSQLASYFENSASWAAALAEHRLIAARIKARDAEGARQAMRAHLQASRDRFSQSFGDPAPRATRVGGGVLAGKTGGGARQPRTKPREERP